MEELRLLGNPRNKYGSLAIQVEHVSFIAISSRLCVPFEEAEISFLLEDMVLVFVLFSLPLFLYLSLLVLVFSRSSATLTCPRHQKTMTNGQLQATVFSGLLASLSSTQRAIAVCLTCLCPSICDGLAKCRNREQNLCKKVCIS